MRAAAALLLALTAAPAFAAPPKLVVVVMVDQLATTYWLGAERVFDGGFARLAKRGAVYPNGVHDQANTATGPGHASVVTGAWPDVHGIVSNEWFDRQGVRVYCVQDPQLGKSPKLLAVPSIADQLALSSHGRARVVSLALKDRVAVLMGGDNPTVSAWWDPNAGQFVRGKYAPSPVPFAALDRANADHADARARNAPWERLRPELDYARLASPDEGVHEGFIPGLGRTFPHAYGQDVESDGYRVSPRLLDGLVAMATRAVDELELGRRGETDMLLLGLTSLDYAGHFWGPSSQEALDVLLRTDRALGVLMDHVERRLGSTGVVWVLSGDHGIAPAPEVTVAFGGRGARVDGYKMIERVNLALAPLAQKGKRPTTVALLDPPLLWLTATDPGVDRVALRRAAAAALRAGPELLDAQAAEDVDRFAASWAPMFRRVLFPGREADVLFVQRPYDLIETDHHTGSGHGSPYVYDTHVPIVIAGPGVRPGRDMAPVPVTRIAPTIAALVGMPSPAAALEPSLPAAAP